MIFNSIEYLLFFPTVFFLYWFVFKKRQSQNVLLLLSSYFFYGWWDWRFLFLIIFSSFVDYFCGVHIDKTNNVLLKKKLLSLSIIVNLGFLGVFKYFNFFSESLSDLFNSIGYNINTITLDVLLPVGISFYTFQTMSYTIDVYKGKIKPSKDIIAFFSFVSFFPQLVAGPIERATNLLPQFYKDRFFCYEKSVDGLRQILWGLFKKVVVADNCAKVVNLIFFAPETYSSFSLFIGAFLFTFQIYCDFSGYSSIAIGTAKIFGFNLKQNFAFPYFSRDIAEFWRRWHISLSTWFRDYVYIPLGGSRGGVVSKIKNTFIIFLISGFWHGANWTFVFWGLINALYFLPLLLMGSNRKNTGYIAYGKMTPSFKDFFQMLGTFSICMLAWVFFRSTSLTNAFLYLNRMFSFEIGATVKFVKPTVFIFILILVEWSNRNYTHGLALLNIKSKTTRFFIYMTIFMLILFFGAPSQDFIYFQF